MTDREDIVEVVDAYLEGMRTGDLQHWEKAFYPDCVVINANEEDAEKSVTPIMDYAKYIKEQHEAGIKCEESLRVSPRISYVGNIANARLLWKFILGDQTINGETFFNLVKRNNIWKVSQKIFYATP